MALLIIALLLKSESPSQQTMDRNMQHSTLSARHLIDKHNTYTCNIQWQAQL